MFKVIVSVLFIVLIGNLSAETNDTDLDQCFRGLDSQLNQYEESLNQWGEDSTQESVVYKEEETSPEIKGLFGHTIDGVKHILNLPGLGILVSALVYIDKLQTQWLSLTPFTLLEKHGGLKELAKMITGQIKINSQFIQANVKFLKLIEKASNKLGSLKRP